MIDAKREAEQIVRDKGGVCLVPLLGRGGISSHEKTFCDCEVERMLADAITRAERRGRVAGLREAAANIGFIEICRPNELLKSVSAALRLDADRLEGEK